MNQTKKNPLDSIELNDIDVVACNKSIKYCVCALLTIAGLAGIVMMFSLRAGVYSVDLALTVGFVITAMLVLVLSGKVKKQVCNCKIQFFEDKVLIEKCDRPVNNKQSRAETMEFELGNIESIAYDSENHMLYINGAYDWSRVTHYVDGASKVKNGTKRALSSAYIETEIKDLSKYKEMFMRYCGKTIKAY